MRYRDCMIAWNPGTSEIRVGPHPAQGWSKGFRMTGGAAHLGVKTMTPDKQALDMLLNFHAIVVRDAVPVAAAHEAFLSIDEYRSIIASDTPGADAD